MTKPPLAALLEGLLMKIICGERTLDLDRLNAAEPDGEHVWSEVRPFTYSPGNLPESDAGTYLLTTDNGAVSLRDMAFKILFDLGVWSGAKCCRYLAREIARSVDAEPDRGWSTGLLPDSGPAGELRDALGLLGVHMPPCGRLVSRNLRALSAVPCDLDESVFGMLSDYIYTDGLSFRDMHAALSEVLASMPPDAFADFVEGVYGVLSCDPEAVKEHVSPSVPDGGQPGDAGGGEDIPAAPADADSGSGDGGGAAGTASVDDAGAEALDGAGDDGQEQPDAESAPVEAPDLHDLTVLERLSKSSAKDMPKGLKPLGIFSSGRTLKGSDLTGTDETFTLDYYAGFYRDAMEKADSQGFADELIRSRAGFGTAPIAILQEAVSKLRQAVDANAGQSQGGNLKSELLGMANIIMAAAGKLEDLPEPIPEPEAPPVPEPDGPSGQAPTGAAEPAGTEPAAGASGVQDVPEPDDMDAYGQGGQDAESSPAVPDEAPDEAPTVLDEPGEEPGAQDGEPSGTTDEAGDEAPEDEVSGAQDGNPGSDGFHDYDEYDEYDDGGDDGVGERPEDDFEDEGGDGEP